MGCHPRPPGLRPTRVNSLPGPPEPSRRAAGPAPSRRPEGARPARDWRRRGPRASRADAGPEGRTRPPSPSGVPDLPRCVWGEDPGPSATRRSQSSARPQGNRRRRRHRPPLRAQRAEARLRHTPPALRGQPSPAAHWQAGPPLEARPMTHWATSLLKPN